MATGTHTLLERITVGSAGASSVTFSSIPQTGYTDLKLVYSIRTTATAASNGYYGTYSFNGLTTNISQRAIYGNGASANSTLSSTLFTYMSDASDYTSSTFSNGELYIPNYTSSNYKSMSQDAVSENNGSAVYTFLYSGLWSNTAAITSIGFTPASGSLVQYSTFSLYGIAAYGTTPTKAPKAVGGDIIQTDGTYWYHAFINTGAFVPATGLSADILVVAGGGSGGDHQTGGGGGAGGYVYTASQSFANGTSYTTTVGGGGAGQGSGAGNSGTNSNVTGGALSLTAAVGGGRGSSGSTNSGASIGGSGGGGDGNYGNPGKAGTAGQGNAGANYQGGGGGAGTAGSTTGQGGAGINTYSSWLSATGLGVSGYIAGGGSGGGTGLSGGAGGGGNSVAGGNGGAGTANTGGGGAGTSGNNYIAGGNGGSGVIIIRYAV